MEIVRDVKSFVKKNGDQLKKLFIYKTGITDRELVHEHLQDFYVKMIQTDALKFYREEKGPFENYICTLLYWLLPYKAKKNVSVQYKFISQVTEDRMTQIPNRDIWDHAGTFEGPFKFDFSPCTPRITDDSERHLINQYLSEFRDYIYKTEPEKSRNQMLTFLNCKLNGCRSTEIALILGVSDNMVKFIKQKVQRKFARWKALS